MNFLDLIYLYDPRKILKGFANKIILGKRIFPLLILLDLKLANPSKRRISLKEAILQLNIKSFALPFFNLLFKIEINKII